MNWKITGRFIITVVSVAIMVMLINIIGGAILIFGENRKSMDIKKDITYSSPEEFTRNFQKYLIENNGKIYVQLEGKDILKQNKAWIQVLDEQGNEVYSYEKPSKVKSHYTPMEIVHVYKYISSDSMSTIFISEKKLNHRDYSYIIGFPHSRVKRNIISYDSYNLISGIKKSIYIILILDTFIALLFGYLFSKRLTNPLVNIIDDIKNLSDGMYNIEREESGIYKEVYHNVNNLAEILNSNLEERKKLDKMKEDWISNISHDIKTPLASVKGYAEILSDKDYTFTKEEVVEYSKIIEDKSNYIKNLIEDLNLTTRLKNKALVLNLKNVNMVSLVRGVVIDILNNPQNGNINIEFSAMREVIERQVDEILMKRVITNILYNAIVHNDNNVNIQVKVEKKDKVYISILDDGRGIKEEELKYIFERYYRGTNTGKSHKGSGLGMAIANDVVKAHNGKINIESQLGIGTKMQIII